MDVTKPQVLSDVQVADAPGAETPEITALVERAKSGDPDAFADLMRLYERRIIALGLQMGLQRDDALDACQDAFIKVFRYIARFRSGQSFYRWLYRIGVHVIFDHLKARRARAAISLEDLPPARLGALREKGPTLERRVEAADMAGKLLEGLDILSKRERVVFALRDLQGMGTDEIGAILRLSQVTVRRHCMAARHKLRQRIFDRDH